MPPASRMPVADPLGEHQMVAVAGRQVAAGLGDADDRPARAQLLQAQAEVQIALEIERGHVDVVRVVEPGGGAQRLGTLVVSLISAGTPD